LVRVAGLVIESVYEGVAINALDMRIHSCNQKTYAHARELLVDDGYIDAVEILDDAWHRRHQVYDAMKHQVAIREYHGLQPNVTCSFTEGDAVDMVFAALTPGEKEKITKRRDFRKAIAHLIRPHRPTDEMERVYKELDTKGREMLVASIVMPASLASLREVFMNRMETETISLKDVRMAVTCHMGTVDVFDDEADEWVEKTYHSPWIDLEDCAASGCSGCHTLTYGWEKYIQKYIMKMQRDDQKAWDRWANKADKAEAQGWGDKFLDRHPEPIIRPDHVLIPIATKKAMGIFQSQFPSVYIKQLSCFYFGKKRDLKQLGRLWRIRTFHELMPWNARKNMSMRDIALSVLDSARRKAKGSDLDTNHTNGYELDIRERRFFKMEEARTNESGEYVDGIKSECESLETGYGEKYFEEKFFHPWTRYQQVVDGNDVDDLDRVEIWDNTLKLPKVNGYHQFAAVIQKEAEFGGPWAKYGYRPYVGIDTRPNQRRLNHEGSWRTVVDEKAWADVKGFHHLNYAFLHGINRAQLRKDLELTKHLMEHNGSVRYISQEITVEVQESTEFVTNITTQDNRVPVRSQRVDWIGIDDDMDSLKITKDGHVHQVEYETIKTKTEIQTPLTRTKKLTGRLVAKYPCWYSKGEMTWDENSLDLWVCLKSPQIHEYFKVEFKSPYVASMVGKVRNGKVRGDIFARIFRTISSK
jgi:hypothetical protein